jgi:diguanylate cyclase (GGDEF)-like protein
VTAPVDHRERAGKRLSGGERLGGARLRRYRAPIVATGLRSTPGAASEPEFADDPGRRAYRRAYITLGAVLTVLISVTSLVYLVSTPEGPHRRVLYALVGGAIATGGAVLVIGRRLVGTVRELPFLLIWSGASMGFVFVAAALDGGATSELLWLLALPVVYAGIGYPLQTVRWIVTAAQAAVVGLMVVGDDWTGTAWYRFGFVASFNVLVVASATTRHAFELGEREMTIVATHDGLTGCLNRGAFLDRVDAECERSRRYSRPVSLLIIDLDRFKDINDALGHQAGDEALRGLAASLLAAVRATDSVGRIGGDEFAVLLLEADGVDAAVTGARLVAAARVTPSPAPLTISVGAATWAGASDDPAALTARADAALYQAKVAGRDRVVTAQQPPS